MVIKAQLTTFQNNSCSIEQTKRDRGQCPTIEMASPYHQNIKNPARKCRVIKRIHFNSKHDALSIGIVIRYCFPSPIFSMLANQGVLEQVTYPLSIMLSIDSTTSFRNSSLPCSTFVNLSFPAIFIGL
jgi:hypothetical protein